MTRQPRATYRWQISERYRLDQAAADLDYLVELGADWVYLSPLLQATRGSDHGYDVVDHSRTDADRGGRPGLRGLAGEAHQRGLGVLVDIVPNHVGVARPVESVWWWDVLYRGRESVHATAFDIDWEFGKGKLRIPVLGDGEDELAALEIRDGLLHYYDNVYPIADGTVGLDAFETPQEVHARQHYELINWRRESADLNYRRFFAVSTLAGVRVEEPSVFADSHAEIRHWIDQGWVDGLRVDHPDGLADPGGYLQNLAALAGGRYVLVEKILDGTEELPRRWKTAGTTGYDQLALIDRVLTDPAGEAPLTALDAELRGGELVWADLVHDAKRQVTDGILRSEVLRLARLVPEIDRADDAIAELLSCFPVYRSYLPAGRDHLQQAIDEAVRRRPDLAEPIVVAGARLHEIGTEVSIRFQQTSGMVMAKGVEDCSFYRASRLASLNEVGGDPDQFAVDLQTFHARQQHRQRYWPHTMNTLATHDTKRGPDVRARIAVLSEVPDRWADALHRWLAPGRLPDGPVANLLLQTAFGAWPVERERLHAYAEKAAREAQTATDWLAPDPEFESQLHALVDALYDDPEFAAEFAALADELAPHGWSNSLAAVLLSLTTPGVPDVYRGTEIFENSLVDPDNRRAVDHAALRELLRKLDSAGTPPAVDSSGAAKLWITSRLLRLRRDQPELFTGYRPVPVSGPAADRIIAYDRGGLIAVAARFPVAGAERGFGDSVLELPTGSWVDILSGRSAVSDLSSLLQHYPVAALVRTDAQSTDRSESHGPQPV